MSTFRHGCQTKKLTIPLASEKIGGTRYFTAGQEKKSAKILYFLFLLAFSNYGSGFFY